jgi:hypothetical protein
MECVRVEFVWFAILMRQWAKNQGPDVDDLPDNSNSTLLSKIAKSLV